MQDVVLAITIIILVALLNPQIRDIDVNSTFISLRVRKQDNNGKKKISNRKSDK